MTHGALSSGDLEALEISCVSPLGLQSNLLCPGSGVPLGLNTGGLPCLVERLGASTTRNLYNEIGKSETANGDSVARNASRWTMNEDLQPSARLNEGI